MGQLSAVRNMHKLATYRSLSPKAVSWKLETGYSLVEILIYISLLALILIALLQSMTLMMRSWRESQGRTSLAATGALALQRLGHDIRAASSIDSASSSFGTTTGSLKIISTDAFDVSTSTTFYATSSMLWVAEGSGAAIALLPGNVEVQGFTVYRIATASSEAVRIVLMLQTATTTTPVGATFYDTFVLRGSY